MHVRALSELWPTLSPAAARSNDDGRVLARIVRLADAHDEPGAGTTLQQVAHLEDLVGEPVLSTAVGIDDRERAGQLSPSAPPGAMAQAWVTAEGELLTLGASVPRSARFAVISARCWSRDEPSTMHSDGSGPGAETSRAVGGTTVGEHTPPGPCIQDTPSTSSVRRCSLLAPHPRCQVLAGHRGETQRLCRRGVSPLRRGRGAEQPVGRPELARAD